MDLVNLVGQLYAEVLLHLEHTPEAPRPHGASWLPWRWQASSSLNKLGFLDYPGVFHLLGHHALHQPVQIQAQGWHPQTSG